MATKMWIALPEQVASVRRREDQRRSALTWCYFGSNISQFDRVARNMTAARHVCVGEELTRVAQGFKESFLKWMGAVGRRQNNRLKWHASSLAFRSTLLHDFFLLVCYTQLVNLWLTADTKPPVQMIVVEDPWLWMTLRRKLRDDDRVIFPGGGRRRIISNVARWTIRIPLVRVYVLLSALAMVIAAKLLFPRRTSVSPPQARKQILLFSWIDSRSLSVAGTFHDSYTGRLDKILNARGACVTRFTPFELPFRLLNRLRPVSALFLVLPRYLRFRDLITTLFSGFRIDDLHGCGQLNGWDYTPLLNREVLQEWGRTAFLRYHLWYYATRAMARSHASAIQCVIYQFENQPVEKMMCLAFREAAPGTPVIGYQSAGVPELLLSYYLVPGEASEATFPDRVVTNGEASLRLFANNGYPRNQLANGGALRFEELRDSSDLGDSAGSTVRSRETPLRVLVALPITKPDAAILLRDLRDVFSSPLYSADQPKPVQFIIVAHPYLPLAKLRPWTKGLPPWIATADRPAAQLLRSVQLCLFIAPTGTWREALLAGVPVLKYLSSLLDLDRRDVLGGIELPTCSRDSLREQVQMFLSQQRTVPPDARRRCQSDVFSPVDEELWVSLVNTPSWLST